ncbi:SulP family inorganic anion transporter, partial [Escherichia coli]|nr:SulP family inorganic anion transporter [Escherichia coli]
IFAWLVKVMTFYFLKLNAGKSAVFGSRFEDINFKGDVFGGVTTAIISLPLALAFGVASGAGAEAGLWGAIMVGLFASLFGGS